ncbi:MAG: hypothetical protein JWN70_6333 [Planctomycetaceae bacterium]|nr:hypothetical protein [Planctomycetaceae bacterium]
MNQPLTLGLLFVNESLKSSWEKFPSSDANRSTL